MELSRPMGSSVDPTFPDAIWAGEVDRTALLAETDLTIKFDDAHGYDHARLLLRDSGAVAGFIDVDLLHGYAMTEQAKRAAAAIPVAEALPPLTAFPPVTVAIVTHNRAHMLKDALDSLLKLDYPDYDILVVDNAPSDSSTKDLVATYPRVSYAVEPVKGSGFGRNTALKLATGEIIACIDDDVVADKYWLTALVSAFQVSANIGCVTGLIPSGELATESQLYFDSRVTWNRILQPVTYSLKSPPADVPLFPFQVGRYGTGANFALRRSILPTVGLFDPAFGAGHITGGAEDIDMFTRVVLAGYSLQVCPNAVAWHRHRADMTALASQNRTYGSGLGAWLTKLALTPRLWPRLVKTVLRGFRQTTKLGDMGETTTPKLQLISSEMERSLRKAERLAILKGPGLYLMQRLYNARLLISPAGWMKSINANPALTLAGILALAQLLIVFVPQMPVTVKVLLLGSFVLYAPGIGLFYGARFDRLMKAILIPLTSVSIVIVLSSMLAIYQAWAPNISLAVLAGCSLLLICGQHIQARRREALWQ